MTNDEMEERVKAVVMHNNNIKAEEERTKAAVMHNNNIKESSCDAQ